MSHSSRVRLPRLLALLIASLIAFLGATAPLAAQCSDPGTPTFGFAITEQLDQLVTFKDTAKTRIDVRFPAVASGSCGWPVVVLVHGLGGSRKDLAVQGRNYARLGYLTAAYDVRGQGDTQALNPTTLPGCSFGGMEERLDLAEIIDWVKTTYATTPKADANRVAVAGPSQGGLHAWAAAALSGKTLPPNARNLTTFPPVKAALVTVFPATHEDVFVPGGQAVLLQLVNILWHASGVRWDSAFQTPLRTLISNENFAGVASFFASDPFRQDRALLATSSTAVCATVGWTDSWANVQPTLDALAALPAATPRNVQLEAALGHGMFGNDRQARLQAQREERWLARFLKGKANGIDVEARIQTSAPYTDAIHDYDPTVLLWNRSYDAWPPANNTSSRYWIRAGGQLLASAPSGAEQNEAVAHVVPNGYGMPAFVLQANSSAKTLMTQVPLPLSSLAWDTAALADDIELAGRPRVQLEVSTTATTLLLHCALFDLPPGGAERYVTSGFVAVRNASTAPTQLVVEMSPVQMRFPKGHALRLRVENLPWRRTLLQDEFVVAPCLSSFALNVEHSASRPSFVDLPLRPLVMPVLHSADDLNVLLGAPQDLRFVIEAPPPFGTSMCLIFFTSSGTAAALPLLGCDPMRFTPDPLTTAFASIPPPWLVGQGSNLGVGGQAYALLGLSALRPLPPGAVGLRLTAAATVFANGFLYPTNSLDFLFK